MIERDKYLKIVDEWIEIYKKDGRPLPPPTNKKYSGKFVLRAGSDLHQALSIRALNEGESLSSFVVRIKYPPAICSTSGLS